MSHGRVMTLPPVSAQFPGAGVGAGEGLIRPASKGRNHLGGSAASVSPLHSSRPLEPTASWKEKQLDAAAIGAVEDVGGDHSDYDDSGDDESKQARKAGPASFASAGRLVGTGLPTGSPAGRTAPDTPTSRKSTFAGMLQDPVSRLSDRIEGARRRSRSSTSALGFLANSFSLKGKPSQVMTKEEQEAEQLARAEHKARTLHRFQLAARSAAVFLSIREDNRFRAKVFGVSEVGVKEAEEELKGASSRYVILPTHPFKRVWEVVFATAVVWTVCRVPFLVAFRTAVLWPGLVCDIVSHIVMLVDVVLLFFTAYVDDGDLVVNKRRIAWRYFTTWFILDAIASVPYLLIWPGTGFALVILLRMLNVGRLEGAERSLLGWAVLNAKHMGLIRLAKLAFYVCLAGHVLACVFFMIASVEEFSFKSWTTLHDVNALPVAEQYLAALYWAFTTLTTVGYGDIVPHTTAERLFAIVCIIAGAATFGSIVGKISTLSAAFNAREVEVQSHLTSLDEFITFYNLPKALREQIRRYHEYLSRMHPFRNNSLLLEDMSPFLRRAVELHLHRHILEAVPILKFGSHGFKVRIVAELQPAYCLANEYLAVFGEVAKEMYFISSGSAREILDKIPATISVLAATNCELFMLTKHGLHDVLEPFPEFEGTLRKVGNLRYHAHAPAMLGTTSKREHGTPTARDRAPLPYGMVSWNEVSAKGAFDDFYNSVLARSRIMQAAAYRPAPRDLSRIRLPPKLEPLVSFLTINAHESWCDEKLNDGWTHGLMKSVVHRSNPRLCPFEELPRDVQRRARQESITLLKLLIAAGHGIEHRDGADGALPTWVFGSGRTGLFTPNPYPYGQDVDLTADQKDICKAVATQQHESWAHEMIGRGWKWGPRHNGIGRHDSQLLPFQYLKEWESKARIETAQNKIRTLVAVGYKTRGVLGKSSMLSGRGGVDMSTASTPRSMAPGAGGPSYEVVKLEERLTEVERVLRQVVGSLHDVKGLLQRAGTGAGVGVGAGARS